MTDFHHIYAHQAEAYEEMISREDYQGNVLRALKTIRDWDGLDVVELGAGTGRLTIPFAERANLVRAFDQAEAMMAVCRRKLVTLGRNNWTLEKADNRSLPVEDENADLCVEGWSIGHATEWFSDDWLTPIEAVLAEMFRVTKPGGTLILLETLGTGAEVPFPPSGELARFYWWLEHRYGFNFTWIRTDYRFDSPEQGAELTRFFFGDALANRILDERLTILPECTGIWWKDK